MENLREVIFDNERIDLQSNPSRVFVFNTLGNPDALNYGVITERFEEIGLTVNNFSDLIQGNLPKATKTIEETLYDGEIREDVTVNIFQLGDRKIEVSHCRRSNTDAPPAGYNVQADQPNDTSYKILYGIRGGAALSLPTLDAIIPVIGGTTAIIQAPVPWNFVASRFDFEYFYVSFPKHSSKRDTIVPFEK